MLTSLRLFTIVAGAGDQYSVFELGKPYDKVPEFVFNVFAFLRRMDQRDRGAIGLRRTS